MSIRVVLPIYLPVLLVVLHSTGVAAAAPQQPNILFVFIDDMGYGDLGCYGHPYHETPNIDRLASEGLRLEQFYVASPICSASRAAVATGQYPARHRLHSYLDSHAANERRGMADYLDPSVPTVARQLQKAGYTTGHVGKWHLGGGRDVGDAPLPADYGFDESFVSFEGLGDRLLMPDDRLSTQSEALGRGKISWARKHQFTEIYVDRAIDFLYDHQESPFYLQLCLNDVHDPLLPSSEQQRAVPDNPARGPGRRYAAVIKNLDQQLGRLFDELDRLNLTANTLVVLASDNGPTAWQSYEQAGLDAPGSTGGLRGRKWSLYEGGIREPLIVRWPATAPAGLVDATSVVCAVDLFPTFCSIAGVDVADLELDGVDMSDALRGEPQRTRPLLFWEYGRDDAYLRPAHPLDRSPQLAVRDGRWKLLMNADGSRKELYDVEASPREYRNVAGLHPRVRDRLAAALSDWTAKLPGYRESQAGDPVEKLLQQGDSLPRGDAPRVDHASLEIRVQFVPNSTDGVLIAHGGEAEGYVLYLKEGILHFAVRSQGTLTTLRAEGPLQVSAAAVVTAQLSGDGTMQLSHDGQVVAEGKKSALVHHQPIDPLDVGRDSMGNVGSYAGDFPFDGEITQVRLVIRRARSAASSGALVTRWSGDVDPQAPWPEYPRPQLVRDRWQNLNGYWQYAVANRGEARPDQWEGRILVPFPIESTLSGVKRRVDASHRVWYRRLVKLPRPADDQRLLLHFGAVDWQAEVWVNDQRVGEHEGGYDPFYFDVTDALRDADEQEIVVAVWDPTDAGPQPRGKQQNNPQGIWYTPVTGIWQTVWCETTPRDYIKAIHATSDVATGELVVVAHVQAAQEVADWPLRVNVANVRNGELSEPVDVMPAEGRSGHPLRIALPEAQTRRWSPAAPWLYGLTIELLHPETGATIDSVASYAGLRSIRLQEDDAGVTRILLNDKPLVQLGLLDQGWWPDGLYTAPTDEALRFDLETTKELGYNLARKHVKVEPARWYYWADRLGVLVWQDMPSPLQNNGERNLVGRGEADLEVTPEYAAIYRRELEAMIDYLRSHPSIVAWIPFNEGWGQHHTNEILALVKKRDPSRLVGGPSGWEDRGQGELLDVHQYPGPGMPALQAGRAAVLGEYGGLGLAIEGHTWMSRDNWGYRSFDSQTALTDAYLELQQRLIPLIQRGLCAAVYTQTTDVEGEVNGVMTYDRNVLKLKPADVRSMHRKVHDAR